MKKKSKKEKKKLRSSRVAFRKKEKRGTKEESECEERGKRGDYSWM